MSLDAPNFAAVEKEAGAGTADATRRVWFNLGGINSALAALRKVVAPWIAGVFVGNLTGNADTVTNGVYTTGSYSDPPWIVALAASKLSGTATLTGLNVETTNPTIRSYDNTGTSNERKARTQVTGSNLNIDALNDDESTKFLLSQASLVTGKVNFPQGLLYGGADVLRVGLGTTDDVVVGDGFGGTKTLHFVDGLFTGWS